MKKAVYAGSFDPPTIGHMGTLKKAAELFDEVVFAVGINPFKKTTFSPEERLEILRVVTAGMSNVTVDYFENDYLVRYAQGVGARYVVRGIRDVNDFSFESAMRHMNEDIGPGIETVFLIPSRHLAHISSSMVKSLIGPPGWEIEVGKFVEPFVLEKLIEHRKRRLSQK